MSYALNLASAPSYLSAPGNDVYNFGTGDFTLQCWVKTTASGTVISRKATGDGKGGFLLVIKPTGVITLATDNGYGFYVINTVATAICDGNWHFLTGVRKSDALSIYLDGNPVSATVDKNIEPPINVNNGVPLFIGTVDQAQEPYNQFTGQLDEVRIWNVALPQSQIQSQMNLPLAGTEAGLVGYYTFGHQDGDDSSNTRNHATAAGEVTYTTPGALAGGATSYIDLVQQAVNGGNYFNHLSPTAYVRVLDTPHVWGMAFGKDIMPQAYARQASFERAIVEIIQKTKYRCDLSSLNSPDPDWVRAIMGAMDTCLTAKMGRTQPTQFRFLFGQTPMVPVGEPTNYADFKAALIRLFRERSQAWEVMPEIWMGRFYRLGAGIISAIQAKLFGSAVIGSDDTKMTWNHTKIISMDGTEALVGGHNLNMDLFRSYPPVHDASVAVHGEAAYGVQLFLNQMWTCSTDLLTKESLQADKLTWVNRDKAADLPGDPLTGAGVPAYMKSKQDALIAMHKSGVQPTPVPQPPSGEQPLPPGIRDQDLQTVADLSLVVFQERIVYDTYEGFSEYKQATRMLTLGKYWNGPAQTTNFQKASEIMKEKLILSAKHIIRMSQMDIVSAWKKNWSDHMVCQWVLQALLANKHLQVQIVVSPLDAGAGAEGDQYSFGSGASRTFDLLKYYMTHDAATDAPLNDGDGARANALTRLHVAPFYYTDKVPAANTAEGSTYKWPNLSPEGYTNTLKQPPLSEEPPVKGVIGSAAMSVLNASGYSGSRTQSAPGNHAKIMIVDDEVYVIGSDNLYPGFLSEVDYLVEGADAVNDLITSYWNRLWQYSGPHSISGSGSSSTNVLLMMEALGVGGTIVSNNKQYFAIMRADGNLCVYRGTPDKQGAYVWGSVSGSQTTGPGGEFFTILQTDGNLCTYHGTPGNQGDCSWDTRRFADGGQFFLIMQDDGNLCVYKGTGPGNQGGFVWGSENT